MIKNQRKAAYGREQIILWEGPCAYVVVTGECHEIMVYSTNHVTHKPAGIT